MNDYDLSENHSRRKFMFKLLLICSQYFLLLLGIFAFIEGETVLGIADLTTISLMETLFVINDKLISLDSGIEITGTVGFFFLYYLFYSGSARNQAFLLTHLLRDYLPRFSPYPEGFVMTILSSYLLVTILMYIYEFSRKATSRRLKDSIAELHKKAIRDGLTGCTTEDIWMKYGISWEDRIATGRKAWHL